MATVMNAPRYYYYHHYHHHYHHRLTVIVATLLLHCYQLHPSWSFSAARTKKQARQFQYHHQDQSFSRQTMSTASTSHVDTSSSWSVAAPARSAGLFRATPLIRSAPLSALLTKSLAAAASSSNKPMQVYLKLDCLQDSGSFKDRGMAHLCWTLQQQIQEEKSSSSPGNDVTDTSINKKKKKKMVLISSSGGNAGLAVATVGAKLGLPTQVVVPQTTKPVVIGTLQSLGATVTVHGEHWNAADALARQRVQDLAENAANDTVAAYISPYDHPLLWTGHSTLVDEIVHDVPSFLSEGGTLIVSVGGGGLLCGALEGLARYQAAAAASSSSSSRTTTVVAAETQGASSFGQAWQAGRVVRLPSIDSVATSLGALEVTPVSLERAQQHVRAGGHVHSAQCTDAEAVEACLRFAKDHRILVEPACGAALAVVYSERLRQQILLEPDHVQGPIVIEVCGGSGVTIELLTKWKEDFGL